MPLSQHQRIALQAVFIAAVAFAVYWPALRGEFLLDDDKLLSDNPLVRAPDGLLRFWGTTEPTDYWPMTNSSFWLEWRLWGTNPTGYHVTNLLLHVAAALLLWAILRKLAIAGAFLAALLFAVHPVNVESVAWIAQRKNTLAMLFFLLSIVFYLRTSQQRTTDDGPRTTLWYWLSLFAFVLAMLSKGSVAVLPVVLLLIIWWQRRRIAGSDLIRTAPFFLVAIVLTGVNVWFQKHGLDVVVRDVNLWQRLAGAAAVVWFYLGKAIAPMHLIFVYPQWQIDASALAWWLPLGAALVLTLVLCWQRNSPIARAMLFAWLVFCAALAPVLGFTDVGFMQYSLVADHYQHIALIAVVALVAAGWSFWQRRALVSPPVANIAAAALVGALSFVTWQQSRTYADAITLYETTLANNPTAWIIHNNLGQKLYLKGNLADARRHYNEALRLHPEYADALNNLGIILAAEGRLPEAIDCYRRALQLRPDHPNAHNSLGNALSDLGRLPEAIDEYQAVLRVRPDDAIAHYNLANALRRLGNTQDAIEHYRRAIECDPSFAEAYANLANTYAQVHRSDEAIAAAQKALNLARSAGKMELAATIEAWLAAHRHQSTSP